MELKRVEFAKLRHVDDGVAVEAAAQESEQVLEIRAGGGVAEAVGESQQPSAVVDEPDRGKGSRFGFKESSFRSDASPNKISFERHSSFTDRCHLSRWAFKLVLRGGNFTDLIPTASRTSVNASQNFASRSWSRYR